jgi:hypothetical protein
MTGCLLTGTSFAGPLAIQHKGPIRMGRKAPGVFGHAACAAHLLPAVWVAFDGKKNFGGEEARADQIRS